MRTKILVGVQALITVSILAGFLVFLLPISRSFPTSDDWTYVEQARLGSSGLLHFVLTSHGDHFIPLMEAAQYALLRASDFDFRSTVAADVIITAVGAASFLYAARCYRGRPIIGDFLIPLLILNLGFGAFGWTFDGQFAIGVSLVGIFLALFLAAIGRESVVWLTGAFLALLASAVTGLNGLTIAGITALVLVAATFVTFRGKLGRWTLMGSGVVLTSCIAVGLFRPPTATARALTFDFSTAVFWLFSLIKSPFVIDAMRWGWLSMVTSTLVLAACVGVARLVRKSGVELASVAVGTMLVAHLGLAAALIIGRSSMQPWVPGLEMHYGYLMVPLIIVSWMVVSRWLDAPYVEILGIALVLLAAHSFWTGTQWRWNYTRETTLRWTAIDNDIASDKPPSALVDAWMPELYFVDSPGLRAKMMDDVGKLRSLRLGGPMWGGRPTAMPPARK